MIIRTIHNRDNPYFQLDRTAVNDERLSYKAIGIYTYLMSKPDGWEANEADIAARHADGRAAIRSGIQELIDCGYMVRVQVRKDKKVVAWRLDTYEAPDLNPHFKADQPAKVVTIDLDTQYLESENTNVGLSSNDHLESEKLQVEKLDVGNRTHSNYRNTVSKEVKKEDPPLLPPSSNEYLPGLPDPRKRQTQARQLATQTAELTKLGIDPKQFRSIVDEVLRGMGKYALADHDERTLLEAQDVARCLVALDTRYKTLDGIKSLFDTWYGNNEFNGKAPYASQVKSYASQILAGKVKNKTQVQPVTNWSAYGGGMPDYMKE